MDSDTSKTPDMQKRNLTRIFVYGSLKQGYALHFLLTNQLYLGEASTAAEYRLLDCGHYPALIKAEGMGLPVNGELYDVDAHCLAQLDEAEGISEGLYERGSVILQPPHHQTLVLAYFYLQSTTGLKDCGTQWPSSS